MAAGGILNQKPEAKRGTSGLLLTSEDPAMRHVRTLCLLLLWVICARGQYNVLTFHGDRQRTGWISNETILTPANVSSGSFGPLWNSPQFDSVIIGGTTYPPHLYASPLYVDSVTMTAGTYAGLAFHVVYAGSSNGFV